MNVFFNFWSFSGDLPIYIYKLSSIPCVRYASKYTKPESESEFYGEQLGGYEHKEEIEPFKSRWRAPFTERAFWKTKFALFGKRTFPADKTRYNPNNLQYFNLKQWLATKKKDSLKHHQQFLDERLQILGCDLAAAHFVVYRGGAVKFVGQSSWIKDDQKKNQEYDDELPNMYKPEYVLEAIDLSGLPIVFDGLKNLCNLKKLKWLSFSNCEYFDNWCLDRISGEHGENLEYLDISHTNVTHHGLNAIYRFRKLKTLKLDDTSDEPGFYHTCIAIKRYMPEVTIEGISQELIPVERKDSVEKDSEDYLYLNDLRKIKAKTN